MQMVVFVLAPVLIFAAVLGEPLFRFLFTEKWLPAVPYFQILCFTGILYPIQTYNINILKVKGRSDLVLKLALVKKIITVIGIIIGIQFGIFGLLYAQVVLSLISFLINAYYTNHFINYSAWQQTKDIFPVIGLAVFSAGVIWFLDRLLYEQIDILRLIVGGLAGGLIYLLLSILFKFSILDEITKLISKK